MVLVLYTLWLDLPEKRLNLDANFDFFTYMTFPQLQ